MLNLDWALLSCAYFEAHEGFNTNSSLSYIHHCFSSFSSFRKFLFQIESHIIIIILSGAEDQTRARRTRGENTKRARFSFHISLGAAISRAYSTCTLQKRNELAAHIKIARQTARRRSNESRSARQSSFSLSEKSSFARINSFRHRRVSRLRFMYDSIYRQSLVKKRRRIFSLEERRSRRRFRRRRARERTP